MQDYESVHGLEGPPVPAAMGAVGLDQAAAELGGPGTADPENFAEPDRADGSRWRHAALVHLDNIEGPPRPAARVMRWR